MDNVIEIKNLVKVYKSGAVRAVDDVTFNIGQGELFAFLGVNGAGKTTTINVLCTLVAKTSGEVKVCGFELGREDNEIRKSIGVVFQQSILDNELSAMNNLYIRGGFYKLSKTEIEKRVTGLIKKLGMQEFIDRPYGKLSGGQRRKTDIARALIGHPKILFLDEPTTGLDPQSRIDLWDTIEQIRKDYKTTIFLTTHYMEEVDGADRVAIIDSGKILCIDTPQKLKSKYSTDEVRFIAKSGSGTDVEKLLKKGKYEYELAVDAYVVKLKRAVEIIADLAEFKPYLESFEVKKGNMDSVFLNVVGRSLVNE